MVILTCCPFHQTTVKVIDLQSDQSVSIAHNLYIKLVSGGIGVNFESRSLRRDIFHYTHRRGVDAVRAGLRQRYCTILEGTTTIGDSFNVVIPTVGDVNVCWNIEPCFCSGSH